MSKERDVGQEMEDGLWKNKEAVIRVAPVEPQRLFGPRRSALLPRCQIVVSGEGKSMGCRSCALIFAQ